MGGHGGLNILPQKRWNVYNRDNRERVRRDEEAAAREEYIKQQEAIKAEAQARLQKLRDRKRKSDSTPSEPEPQPRGDADDAETLAVRERDADAGHIKLIADWNEFGAGADDEDRRGRKAASAMERRAGSSSSKLDKEMLKEAAQADKRRKKDEEDRAMLPIDDSCRLARGLAGKDVQKPWYLCTTSFSAPSPHEHYDINATKSVRASGEHLHKKRSLQELREERLKRERQERERATKLVSAGSSLKDSKDIGQRCKRYNSGFGHGR